MIPIAGRAAQFMPTESVMLELNVFSRSRRTPFPRSVEASMGDMFPKEATARLALNRCRTTRRWSDKTISARREVCHQMLTPHETPHRLHYLESSMGDQRRGRSSDFGWWFTIAAVCLSPILIFWIVNVIGQLFLRRKRQQYVQSGDPVVADRRM
jgi:hypothetical protein